MLEKNVLVLLLLAAGTAASAWATPAAAAPKRVRQNAMCLGVLSEAFACEQDVHAMIPADRYTCSNLTDILACYAPPIEANCYGMRPKKRLKREMLIARNLFPEHDCDGLDVRAEEAVRLYRTNKNNRCDPRQELKMGIALDGCSGFLLGKDPGLVKGNPCLAMEAFKKGCSDVLLPKCFKPGSARYRAQEVVALANLLSFMAAENNLSVTLDTSAKGCEPLRKDFGKDLLLEVRGPDLTPDDKFVEDPEATYFAQSWRPLYESIMEGDYKPPGETELTKDDILNFVQKTLED